MESSTARTSAVERERAAPPAPASAAGRRRWLLFVHQVPSRPSNLRVSTWRRLQQLGAVPLKQAAYVLPDTPDTREDFEWLAREVVAHGGTASVLTAEHVDERSDAALVDEFRRTRQRAYTELSREAARALKRLGGTRRAVSSPHGIQRVLDAFRQRLNALERTDFFGSTGRDRVISLLQQLEDRTAPPRPRTSKTAAGDPPVYHKRLWVTRPRPGVDRMSSAWLIRKFIDREARFDFSTDRLAVPEGAIPFDMFGVELSHHGDGCTFETLCAVFGLGDPVLPRIAAIVHDLDLKDGKFGPPEAGAIGTLIEGLQLTHQDDAALLEQGMTLFEGLYRSFEHAARPSSAKASAKPKQTRSTRPRRRRT